MDINVTPVTTTCKLTWSRMLHLEVFISKLITIDWFPTSSITTGEITTLDHKAWYNPMECAPFIMKRPPTSSLSFLSWNEMLFKFIVFTTKRIYTDQDWFQLIMYTMEKTISKISSGTTLKSNKESIYSCRATSTKRSKVFCTKGMIWSVTKSCTWN